MVYSRGEGWGWRKGGGVLETPKESNHQNRRERSAAAASAAAGAAGAAASLTSQSANPLWSSVVCKNSSRTSHFFCIYVVAIGKRR